MRLRLIALTLLMLVCYALPWLINPGVSLSPGGYDLAEWSSLHYAVRAESPMLLTSFLLRLPLALIALLVGVSSPRKVLSAIVIVLLAIAMLPPLEIIYTPSDPNYMQQAAVALIALVGGFIGWSGVLKRWQSPILIGIGVIGALAVVWGLATASGLMRGFDLPTQTGFGGVALALLFAFSGLLLRNAKSAGTQSR